MRVPFPAAITIAIGEFISTLSALLIEVEDVYQTSKLDNFPVPKSGFHFLSPRQFLSNDDSVDAISRSRCNQRCYWEILGRTVNRIGFEHGFPASPALTKISREDGLTQLSAVKNIVRVFFSGGIKTPLSPILAT